jgi:hypothetical protein
MRYYPRKVLASTGVLLGGILLGCDGGGGTTTTEVFDPKAPPIEKMKEAMSKANAKVLKRIGAAPAPGGASKQP